MSDPILFDEFRVSLFLPDSRATSVIDAARAALDDPRFLEAVRDAVQQLLITNSALAVLALEVAW